VTTTSGLRPSGYRGADETSPPPRPNPIELAVRRVDKFQQAHTVLGFPWAVLQKFGNDQAGSRAALIAYYGLFALFPLLLLFTTILGYVLQGDDALRRDLENSALGTFPIIGDQLRSETHSLEGSGAALAIGVLLLLYGALGLGQATQSGMNAVWNVPYVRRPNWVLRHVRAIGVLILLALSTIGSTVLTGFATLATDGWAATAILLVGSAVVNFILTLAAFKVMTAAPLRWREVALGAALATVFWQSLQAIGSWYVGRELAHNSNTYGFFGVVIVLLSWIYLGAQLFLLAAEINVVRRYHLWPRSIVQPPLTEADKEVFERLAQMSVRRPEAELSVAFTPEADRDPLRSGVDSNDEKAENE
jgi:YihY family inner membrane protein